MTPTSTAGATKYEIGIALPAPSNPSSSRQPATPEPPEGHLWDMAAEKVAVHAVVLKHLAQEVLPASTRAETVLPAPELGPLERLRSQEGASPSFSAGSEAGGASAISRMGFQPSFASAGERAA